MIISSTTSLAGIFKEMYSPVLTRYYIMSDNKISYFVGPLVTDIFI